jgi:hypothetical protein
VPQHIAQRYAAVITTLGVPAGIAAQQDGADIHRLAEHRDRGDQARQDGFDQQADDRAWSSATAAPVRVAKQQGDGAEQLRREQDRHRADEHPFRSDRVHGRPDRKQRATVTEIAGRDEA